MSDNGPAQSTTYSSFFPTQPTGNARSRPSEPARPNVSQPGLLNDGKRIFLLEIEAVLGRYKNNDISKVDAITQFFDKLPDNATESERKDYLGDFQQELDANDLIFSAKKSPGNKENTSGEIRGKGRDRESRARRGRSLRRADDDLGSERERSDGEPEGDQETEEEFELFKEWMRDRRKKGGEMKRRNPSPSDSDDSDGPSSPSDDGHRGMKKRRRHNRGKKEIRVEKLPWTKERNRGSFGQEREREQTKSFRKTVGLLAEYQKDIAQAEFYSRACYDNSKGVPTAQWKKILKGEVVNLDHFLTAIYSTEVDEERTGSIGGITFSLGEKEPKRKVTTEGEWWMAWNLAAAGIGYCFPHRKQELADYTTYVGGHFVAKHPTFHHRVIHFDIFVRNYVGGGESTLLTDTEEFRTLAEKAFSNCSIINYRLPSPRLPSATVENAFPTGPRAVKVHAVKLFNRAHENRKQTLDAFTN